MKMVATKNIPGTKDLTNYQPNIDIAIFVLIGTKDFTLEMRFFGYGGHCFTSFKEVV